MIRRLRADLFRHRRFSPKQALILASRAKHFAIDGGRRFGKSYVAAAKFVQLLHERMARAGERIAKRELLPWAGATMTKAKARHQSPHVEAWIVTPRERHLEQCRAYIQGYYIGQLHRFLHRDLALCDGGRQMWYFYNGIAARVRFVVGKSAAGMVSGALDLLWRDEAGMLDNEVKAALDPVLWERDAYTIDSGTPELGTDHWFTRQILAGLDPNHELYDKSIVEPDPEALSIIGSSFDAFLPEVRQAAKRDATRNGEAWAKQWLYGDWSLPSLFVYDEWNERVHGCDYTAERPVLHGVKLGKPNAVVGVKDWAYAAKNPGAIVAFHVWYKNPLDREDNRPLVIALEDKQLRMEYTRDGWWGVMGSMRDRHGIPLWYADPSAPEMIRQARNNHKLIGPVRPAEKGDKWGRINLLRALLHYSVEADVKPAFYVNLKRCPNLVRQFPTYRMAVRQTGEVTEKTIDYDDHCLDCCAFLLGKVMRGGYSVPDLGQRI